MTTDERLKNLIARFVLGSTYWGYLFSMVRRVEIKDLESIMGVAPQVDGTIVLMYHPELVDGTSDEDLKMIFEHEGMHLLNKHISRLLRIIAEEPNGLIKKNRCEIFNIAADTAVNEQANLKTPITIHGKPYEWILPETNKLTPNQSTEGYYLQLLKDLPKKKVPMIGGHGKWMAGGVSDLHSFSRKLEQYTNNIIRESLKTFNKSRGKLPGHIEDLIKEALAPPKAPYYQIIRKLVVGTRYTKYKAAPSKLNKKRAYTFFLPEMGLPQILPFPGKKRDLTFFIVILIDTSGSMDKEAILDALSGIKNIIDNDRYCKVTVLEVDGAVQKEYNVSKVADIDFKIKGRGGTTLGPGLKKAMELGCDVCLGFTDAATENINDYPKKMLPKKIIWVVPEGNNIESLNRTGPVVRINSC